MEESIRYSADCDKMCTDSGCLETAADVPPLTETEEHSESASRKISSPKKISMRASVTAASVASVSSLAMAIFFSESMVQNGSGLGVASSHHSACVSAAAFKNLVYKLRTPLLIGTLVSGALACYLYTQNKAKSNTSVLCEPGDSENKEQKALVAERSNNDSRLCETTTTLTTSAADAEEKKNKVHSITKTTCAATKGKKTYRAKKTAVSKSDTVTSNETVSEKNPKKAKSKASTKKRKNCKTLKIASKDMVDGINPAFSPQLASKIPNVCQENKDEILSTIAAQNSDFCRDPPQFGKIVRKPCEDSLCSMGSLLETVATLEAELDAELDACEMERSCNGPNPSLINASCASNSSLNSSASFLQFPQQDCNLTSNFFVRPSEVHDLGALVSNIMMSEEKKCVKIANTVLSQSLSTSVVADSCCEKECLSKGILDGTGAKNLPQDSIMHSRQKTEDAKFQIPTKNTENISDAFVDVKLDPEELPPKATSNKDDFFSDNRKTKMPGRSACDFNSNSSIMDNQMQNYTKLDSPQGTLFSKLDAKTVEKNRDAVERVITSKKQACDTLANTDAEFDYRNYSGITNTYNQNQNYDDAAHERNYYTFINSFSSSPVPSNPSMCAAHANDCNLVPMPLLNCNDPICMPPNYCNDVFSIQDTQCSNFSSYNYTHDLGSQNYDNNSQDRFYEDSEISLESNRRTIRCNPSSIFEITPGNARSTELKANNQSFRHSFKDEGQNHEKSKTHSMKNSSFSGLDGFLPFPRPHIDTETLEFVESIAALTEPKKTSTLEINCTANKKLDSDSEKNINMNTIKNITATKNAKTRQKLPTASSSKTSLSLPAVLVKPDSTSPDPEPESLDNLGNDAENSIDTDYDTTTSTVFSLKSEEIIFLADQNTTCSSASGIGNQDVSDVDLIQASAAVKSVNHDFAPLSAVSLAEESILATAAWNHGSAKKETALLNDKNIDTTDLLNQAVGVLIAKDDKNPGKCCCSATKKMQILNSKSYHQRTKKSNPNCDDSARDQIQASKKYKIEKNGAIESVELTKLINGAPSPPPVDLKRLPEKKKK